MAIKYPEILEVASTPHRFKWGDRETILYALGIGLGSDPLSAAELPFVYEKNLKAIPTIATVLAWGAGPDIEQMGFNPMLSVHGEEQLVIHRPLPAAGEVSASGRVTQVIDKGEGKGAIIIWETYLRDAEGQELIATLTTTCFARGDGGFGGPTGGPPAPHLVPERAPDLSLDFPTRPDQALLYRLSGDRNPLHADPAFAAKAKFSRPILHGLCTYGICCRAVLQAFADFDPARLKSHQVRFSAPVFPGETITVDLWRDGDVVSFEARVKERDVLVIKNGKALLASQV